MPTPLTRLLEEPEDARRRRGTLHTPAEILQQPDLWKEAARIAGGLDLRIVLAGLDYAILSGIGSSLYTAKLIRDSVREVGGAALHPALGARARAVSASDLLLAPEESILPGRGLLVSLSRSGESPEVVEAAKRIASRYRRISHLGITCNPDGSLARLLGSLTEAATIVLPPRAYDRGMAMTSSVTSMVAAGRAAFGAFDATSMAAACERMLGRAEEAEAVAAKEPHRVVLLGTGPLEAAAEEGALKILEMTDGQVAVLARNFLEFRHGPLNFVDRKTVVLCFHSPVPGKRRYEDDLVAQVRKSGQVLDLVALEPEGAEADAALLAVVFAQMVALFLTLRRGLTPDLPGDRGLIHRVVRGVTIHPGGTA